MSSLSFHCRWKGRKRTTVSLDARDLEGQDQGFASLRPCARQTHMHSRLLLTFRNSGHALTFPAPWQLAQACDPSHDQICQKKCKGSSWHAGKSFTLSKGDRVDGAASLLIIRRTERLS